MKNQLNAGSLLQSPLVCDKPDNVNQPKSIALKVTHNHDPKLWSDDTTRVEATPNPLIGSYDQDGGSPLDCTCRFLCCCHVLLKEVQVMLVLNQKSVLKKKTWFYSTIDR